MNATVQSESLWIQTCFWTCITFWKCDVHWIIENRHSLIRFVFPCINICSTIGIYMQSTVIVSVVMKNVPCRNFWGQMKKKNLLSSAISKWIRVKLSFYMISYNIMYLLVIVRVWANCVVCVSHCRFSETIWPKPGKHRVGVWRKDVVCDRRIFELFIKLYINFDRGKNTLNG